MVEETTVQTTETDVVLTNGGTNMLQISMNVLQATLGAVTAVFFGKQAYDGILGRIKK